MQGRRLGAYRAFLNHPVEHDDGPGFLFPNHEPEVATRVPERALETTNAHAEQSCRYYEITFTRLR